MSHIPSDFKKYRFLIVAVILTVWGMILRYDRLAMTPDDMPGDGGYQLRYLMNKNTFIEALMDLPKAEHGGFLSGDFLLVYPFLKFFGWNKWGFTLPHFLLTVVGFFFLHLLCCRYLKTLWAHCLVFMLVAFNWNLIFYTVEVRAYAVLPTIALMSLFFSELLIEKIDRLNMVKKIWIGLFFLLALWFHLYGVMMVGVCVLYALGAHLKQSYFKSNVKAFILFFMIVGLIAAPLWLVSVIKYRVPLPETALGQTTFIFIANPFKEPITFLKNILGNLLGWRPGYLLLPALFFPWIFPVKSRYQQICGMVLLVFLPIGILLWAAWSSHYYFLQRQFTWVMPFFALFLAWHWESLMALWLNPQRVKNSPKTLQESR